MKQDSSNSYRFHLRMWQATDPYNMNVQEASAQDTPYAAPLEARALDAVVHFLRRTTFPRRDTFGDRAHRRKHVTS